jgi:hypothetical protein
MPALPSTLTAAAELIGAAIDSRQAALGRRLSEAEQVLYAAVMEAIVEKLSASGGQISRTVRNMVLVSAVEGVFDRWAEENMRDLMADFVANLAAVAAMTGGMYEAEATEAEIEEVQQDNALLFAALGVSAGGSIVTGSVLWEVYRAAEVRRKVRNALLQGVKAEIAPGEMSKLVRELVRGSRGEPGALTAFWRTYAYDLFEQAVELKNEQYRQKLRLRWLVYVGDIIQDSRDFCVLKAGRVFADVEADENWPKDPTLPGRGSGIPYTPRIDRGRWNCRHRIRYITRETAVQLDARKVKSVEAKYGRLG